MQVIEYHVKLCVHVCLCVRVVRLLFQNHKMFKANKDRYGVRCHSTRHVFEPRYANVAGVLVKKFFF